jgi:hypothetical protein
MTALATAEAVVEGPYVTEHSCGSATEREPGTRNPGIDADERQVQQRDDARPDHSFANVDQHDAQREGCPLRSQRIGSARIAAAHGANIDATANTAHDHGTHDRAQEVAKQELDAEFEHHT